MKAMFNWYNHNPQTNPNHHQSTTIATVVPPGHSQFNASSRGINQHNTATLGHHHLGPGSDPLTCSNINSQGTVLTTTTSTTTPIPPGSLGSVSKISSASSSITCGNQAMASQQTHNSSVDHSGPTVLSSTAGTVHLSNAVKISPGTTITGGNQSTGLATYGPGGGDQPGGPAVLTSSTAGTIHLANTVNSTKTSQVSAPTSIQATVTAPHGASGDHTCQASVLTSLPGTVHLTAVSTPGIKATSSSSMRSTFGIIQDATKSNATITVQQPGHHPTPGLTTTHHVNATTGTIHQTTTTATPSQQQQQQFQRLKVEDALSYLDQVKFKFNNQPQVYNDFLDIMKEFKSQSIDTPGVIQRVSNLFKGHPELIVGFNTFLPPGYKIEMQSNDQVNVSMPSSNTVIIQSTGHTITTQQPLVSGPTALLGPSPGIQHPNAHPIQVATGPSVHSGPTVKTNFVPTGTPTIQVNATNRGNPPANLVDLNIQQPIVPATNVHNNAMHTVVAAANGGTASNTGTQPVEFNHAINYVNKIKNRFQAQPEVYKQFLEILHAYQKEQKCLKEGKQPENRPLSESEVYSQVAKLFQNQEDLLAEFGQFLPDANAASGATASVLTVVGHTAGVTSSLSNSASHNSNIAAVSSISVAVSAAHHVDSLAAANRAAKNDHGAIIKKPIARGGSSALDSPLNQTSGLHSFQIKRQASNPPQSSQVPLKKPKMTSLRDVTLAEAGKYGSLNEFAFFDKVRKALRSQDVYDNFLRCLVLYNHEIVSRSELVQLITPFLGKFPELLRWFKDFLGYKDGSSGSGSNSTSNATSGNLNSFMEGLPQRVVGIRERERERINSEVGMEIDYASCKRYGASYRALPKNYPQPKCSGRTLLCREVLNDTWVSFPSWSEDSTFVTSRKTQYEEYIYRCEDERFELDVVIETNLSTIRVLEAVQKRLGRMTPDERNKFKLDETLGGTSTVIHQRAIKRIYGDKAQEIIEGLKKNPAVAVPLVLRRLKAKEEEWREAQKQFNKIWREQNEKYYLKSLDHQGISFKQNDVKYLRSKTLLNEIETIFEERHEQNEENSSAADPINNHNIQTGPHMTFVYKDKHMIEEACSLIIHHVKRQTSIHKEDKQKIKQLLRQFIPDLFAAPRGELSDDELEEMEVDREDKKVLSSNHRNLNKDIDNQSNKYSKNPNTIPPPNGSANRVTMHNEDPNDSYTLFFINNNWYLFFRLHHILCERLGKMNDRARILAMEEARDKTNRKESTAVALRLKPKNEIEIEEFFPSFVDMVKQILDGNLDSNQYEDMLREMFGIHAYVAFTLDKVVQNIVRQLQHLVCDESCFNITELFLEETKNNANGGLCVTSQLRANQENAYQKKSENLLTEENCFKLIIYKGEGKLTIELLDTENPDSEDGGEIEKWSEYVEKYVKEDENISDELKERLSRKPVFLPRNIRTRRRSENIEEEESTVKEKSKESCSSEKLPEKADNTSDNLDIVDNTQCKFNVNSFKMVYIVQSESYLYRRMALVKAKMFHKKVSRHLHEKFNIFHAKWLEDKTSNEDRQQCDDWFSGRIYKISSTETTSNELPESESNLLLGLTGKPLQTIRDDINNLEKPPYRPYCKYRTLNINSSESTVSNSS